VESGYYLLDIKWIGGMLILFLASVVHAAVLPFADLVLLSTHCCWAVIFSQLLSRIILKEKFLLKYDLPAMTCIVTGCLMIVFNANLEEVQFSKGDIETLLFSPGNLMIYCLLTLFYLISKICDFCFSKTLR